MRRITVVQEIATDVDNHWKVFFDDEFEMKQALEGLGFASYEIVEVRREPERIYRKTKGQPKLELPAVVAKALGPRFGYTEEGTFDKATGVWRSRLTPNILTDRLSSDAVVRCEPAGEGRCRRICELSVEAKVFGIGSLIETALEKDLRSGWERSATFLNAWLKRV
jgi:Protein of unknown function (DUF2505)